MCEKNKYKGFSLLELIIVILLIGITSAIAIPNINDWITDRKIKKEAISFVQYLEGKKSQIQQGGHPVLGIGIRTNPYSVLHYMTREEFNIQMQVPAPGRTNRNNASKYDNKSIMNYYKACSCCLDTIDYAKWNKTSEGVWRWGDGINSWPNMTICMSKDSILDPGASHFNFTTVDNIQLKGAQVICSKKNSTNSGSKRCNATNKIKHRYLVQIDRSLNIEIYKYNLKKDKWVLQ